MILLTKKNYYFNQKFYISRKSRFIKVFLKLYKIIIKKNSLQLHYGSIGFQIFDIRIIGVSKILLSSLKSAIFSHIFIPLATLPRLSIFNLISITAISTFRNQVQWPSRKFEIEKWTTDQKEIEKKINEKKKKFWTVYQSG